MTDLIADLGQIVGGAVILFAAIAILIELDPLSLINLQPLIALLEFVQQFTLPLIVLAVLAWAGLTR